MPENRWLHHGTRVRRRGKDPFRNDEGGFTTLTVAVSLLLALVLLFGAAQVRWVQSESPDIQFVADSAALAAENTVAEYYTVARIADAMILSMSLLTLTVYGVATVLCCIPVTAAFGADLMTVGGKIGTARDKLSDAAKSALDTLQEALPYLCMVNASAVIEQNSEECSYVGTAIPLPFSAGDTSLDDTSLDSSLEDIEGSNTEAAESVEEAEQYLEAAQEAKETAYAADCGDYPEYCLYERAGSLSSISSAANPYYSSVDYWSFEVALNRAKAYYRARLADEAPEGDSIEEKVRSECRKVFYEYAVEVLEDAYVVDDDGFSAYFPTLPVNTGEMKETHMYTDETWWVSSDGTIHGSPECSAYLEAGAYCMGSLAELDSGVYSECDVCSFSSSSLGSVGSASSRIGNGFEYYYRIVAEQAEVYEECMREAEAAEEAAREYATAAFDTFGDAIAEIAGSDSRYDPTPPGRYGCIAVVVDISSHDVSSSLQTSLLDSDASIGTRVAISAAALAEDDSEESENIISSMLDGVYEDSLENGSGSLLAGGLGWVTSLWGSALSFYSDGVESLSDGIEGVLDSIPVIGESSLGTWAKEALLETLDSLGLEPAELSSPKPLVVNTSHVLEQGNETLASALSDARMLLNEGVLTESIELELFDGESIEILIPDDVDISDDALEYLYELLEGG